MLLTVLKPCQTLCHYFLAQRDMTGKLLRRVDLENMQDMLGKVWWSTKNARSLPKRGQGAASILSIAARPRLHCQHVHLYRSQKYWIMERSTFQQDRKFFALCLLSGQYLNHIWDAYMNMQNWTPQISKYSCGSPNVFVPSQSQIILLSHHGRAEGSCWNGKP